MNHVYEPGLGELFRHLVELTDNSSDSWYKAENLHFRPRYTPIMRILVHGSACVSEINKQLNITQGAVSQTIKLMIEDGLVYRHKGKDARQSIISLTAQGQDLVDVLKPHWDAMFTAIKTLEEEISLPLMDSLKRTVLALEEKPYATRVIEAKRERPSEINESKLNNFFEHNGKRYSSFRPEYPQALAKQLAITANRRVMALDVGCGNGQLTKLLAPYFETVIGADPSQSQLDNAVAMSNVKYVRQPAECMRIDDNSVDLITVAQAAHWFDLDSFYSEVRRVARPDAIIALISYGVPYIADPINSFFQQAYWQELHEFWTEERAQVETHYTDLYFPFEPVAMPAYCFQKPSTVEAFISYMKTWSSYTVAKSKNAQSTFENVFNTLRRVWPSGEEKEVVWPISVKAGKIN